MSSPFGKRLKTGWGIFGAISGIANVGYGIKKGYEGERHTTEDVFNPFTAFGKTIGQIWRTHNEFKQARGQGDIEVSLLQERARTPPFTTNIRTPPNLSEMTRTTNTGSTSGPRND